MSKYGKRGLYSSEPRSKKYSQILSEIHEPEDAIKAAAEMETEFKQNETRGGKDHVKQAIVERANRAKVASTNMNYSPEARDKEAKIAEIFYASEKRMILPPKKET